MATCETCAGRGYEPEPFPDERDGCRLVPCRACDGLGSIHEPRDDPECPAGVRAVADVLRELADVLEARGRALAGIRETLSRMRGEAMASGW